MAAKLSPPLQRLNRRLLRMNKLVSSAVEQAVQSLTDQDQALAEQVVQGDDRIDAAEVRIEQSCIELVVKTEHIEPEQFRYVLCLIKINNDLERVADCAVNIAGRLPSFVRSEAPGLPPDLRIMANSAAGMLRDAVKAWVAQDCELAKEVMKADDVVDALYDQLARDLADRLTAATPNSRHYLAYLLAARDFERIADHATNIAESVVHSATGQIVRHQEIHY